MAESPEQIEKFYIQPAVNLIASLNKDIIRINGLGTSAKPEHYQAEIDLAIGITSQLNVTYQNYPEVFGADRYNKLRNIVLGFKDKIIELSQRGYIETIWDTAVNYWVNQMDNLIKSDLVQGTLKKYRDIIIELDGYKKKLPSLPPDKRADAEKIIALAEISRKGIQIFTLGYIDTLAGTTGLGFIQIAAIPAGVLIAGCVIAVATLVTLIILLRPLFGSIPKLFEFPTILVPAIVLIAIFAVPKFIGKKTELKTV